MELLCYSNSDMAGTLMTARARQELSSSSAKGR
jgi:hypothetical protein